MTEQDIIAGNKLIALFMGFEEGQIQMEEWCGCNAHQYNPFLEDYEMSPYYPNRDWNLLMEAIIKCHTICNNKCKELEDIKSHLDDPNGWRAWSYRYVHLKTDINYVYNKVVDFIKWFNQIKQNP